MGTGGFIGETIFRQTRSASWISQGCSNALPDSEPSLSRHSERLEISPLFGRALMRPRSRRSRGRPGRMRERFLAALGGRPGSGKVPPGRPRPGWPRPPPTEPERDREGRRSITRGPTESPAGPAAGRTEPGGPVKRTPPDLRLYPARPVPGLKRARFSGAPQQSSAVRRAANGRVSPTADSRAPPRLGRGSERGPAGTGALAFFLFRRRAGKKNPDKAQGGEKREGGRPPSASFPPFFCPLSGQTGSSESGLPG